MGVNGEVAKRSGNGWMLSFRRGQWRNFAWDTAKMLDALQVSR